MPYLVFSTSRVPGVVTEPIMVPLRFRSQVAPGGLVAKAIFSLVPLRMVAQPCSPRAARTVSQVAVRIGVPLSLDSILGDDPGALGEDPAAGSAFFRAGGQRRPADLDEAVAAGILKAVGSADMAPVGGNR